MFRWLIITNHRDILRSIHILFDTYFNGDRKLHWNPHENIASSESSIVYSVQLWLPLILDEYYLRFKYHWHDNWKPQEMFMNE